MRNLKWPSQPCPHCGAVAVFFLSHRSRQQEQSIGRSGAGGKKSSETGEIPTKIVFGCGRAAQLGLAKMARYSERILDMLVWH